MKTYKLDEVKDPLAKKLAEEFLPEVEESESLVEEEIDGQPAEPERKVDWEHCTCCPYADQLKRLVTDKFGNETVIQAPTPEKADVQCLILVEKFKPKKVGGQWIIPPRKSTKCIHPEKGPFDVKLPEKLVVHLPEGQYGWENVEVFRRCEVTHPPKKEFLGGSVLVEVKSLISFYGPHKFDTSQTHHGFASPTYLKKNPSFARYLEEKRVEEQRTQMLAHQNHQDRVEKRELRRIK